MDYGIFADVDVWDRFSVYKRFLYLSVVNKDLIKSVSHFFSGALL